MTGPCPLVKKPADLHAIRIGVSVMRAFLLLQIQHNQKYYNSCTVKKQPLFVIKILEYMVYI